MKKLQDITQTLNELSKSTLGSYVKKASQDSTISRKIAADFEHRGKRAKSQDMKDTNAGISNDFKQKSWKRQDNVNKAVDRLTKEEKDPREYDFEGDMAKGDLRSIIHNAQQVHDMLEDDTNLPEWVQSKITLAEDYVSTVANYMRSEVQEGLIGPTKLNTGEIVTVKAGKRKTPVPYHIARSTDPLEDRAKIFQRKDRLGDKANFFKQGLNKHAAYKLTGPKGKLPEEMEMDQYTIDEARVHPNAIHVSPVKTSQGTRYKVHAVGKNFTDHIKVGEHLTDTELDDFEDKEIGGKIKHLGENSLSSVLAKFKSPVIESKDEDDDKDEDESSDKGPEANQNIHVQLKRAADAHDMKGGADVHFEDGSKHFVNSEHAKKVVGALEKLKPADRAEASSHIYKSHDNFEAIHKMLN